MDKKSLQELYNETKNQPTPGQLFVADVAKIACKSETTVRMWLAGKQTPDALTQTVIANAYNVDVNYLFPSRHGNDNDRT